MSDLWHEDLGWSQARTLVMRSGIAQTLFMAAADRLRAECASVPGSLYLIDTMTNKGCRVDYDPFGMMFCVKISSRTGEALLADLVETFGYMADDLVIID